MWISKRFLSLIMNKIIYKHGFTLHQVRRSLFLFLLAIDWTMETSTMNQQNGIQGTLCPGLDLDFTGDLSHTPTQMQDTTSMVATTPSRLGLNINRVTVNIANKAPIGLDGEALEEVENVIVDKLT